MDEYSGKRASDGLVSRKGPGLVLRDTPNKDRNAQVCSRLGCSGLNSVKGAQIEKAKPSRPAFRSSSSGKEIVGSSSRSCVSVGSSRKSIREPCKKLSCNLETDSSETSSVQDDPEVSEVTPPPGKIQRGLHPESKSGESSEVSLMEVGSSDVLSNTRSRRNFDQRTRLRNQETLLGSSVPFGSKNNNQTTRPSTTRNGLRNLKCNSVSDVVPSSCSSSDSSINRREIVKKRISEGESSSASKGKKINGSSSGKNSTLSHGISIADSRRGRNVPPNRDNSVASVRTRRTVTGHTRARISNQVNVTMSSNGSSSVGPHISQPDVSVDLNGASSSRHLSSEASLSRANSYSRPGSTSRPGSSGGSLRGIMRSGTADIGFSRSLMNQDGQRRYNRDGIAEVLLALERIEHDEELSFEQILVLETNFFLNGLNFYDQHRDMRLDIDNMSYEELLALEERMGSVSTALPEESLTDCIKKNIYQSEPLEDASIDCDNKDEVKCSICQEEYVAGDEVGRLRCEHSYHVVCINQWLRIKNWCPICKAAAAAAAATSPSPPPSSPSSAYST
ncbi:uncharacterized protein LOC126781997 [Argentina anserina]|uniref:uncharacterized protein LOC126781997 n=1 Tax=Argentina anserina TaxID=57926 RepID=UPI0021765CE0|nr:uncharacterized protein LOC126781997 [Potentilla anserina]XP_050363094.1 uncharacterized protein LOC126781997 [Potentilla anserina]XP_050363095.1 uncharacterized protein LOC126781997 [Potentilla anserina]